MSSMQQALRAQLMAIMHAVTFPAPGMVALAGREAPRPAGGVPSFQTPGANQLVAQLQILFYEYCYCRSFDGAATVHPAVPMPGDDLAPALSAANVSRDRWDAGWQVKQSVPDGRIVAVKGSTARMAWPGEFHTLGAPGAPVRPGTEVSLFAARESLLLQPGFYFAFGETLPDQQEEFGVVRFYWNVNVHGAPRLVGAITRALNHFAIPFHFKCLRLQAAFDRSDAAVLYVARRYARVVTMLLSEIYFAVRNDLDPAVPLFSKELADGLGFAEDPQTGESFGMNRCRLMAEAVCRAHERGHGSAEARLSEVAAAFAAAGLSLERPWLRAGAVDPYDLVERLAA